MSDKPSPSKLLAPSASVRTRNLFEVAVLAAHGIQFDDATRVAGKVVFTYCHAGAAQILADHRSVGVAVNSRAFVNEINAARDVAFAL